MTPLDMFANEIFLYIGKYLKLHVEKPQFKVFQCKSVLWRNGIWQIAHITQKRSRDEYIRTPQRNKRTWSQTNGFVVHINQWLLNYVCSFDKRLASSIAPYDFVIFINTTKLMRFTEERRQPELFADMLLTIVTHECVHIYEHLTNRTIIKGFDAEREFECPLVIKILNSFVKEKGSLLEKKIKAFKISEKEWQKFKDEALTHED